MNTSALVTECRSLWEEKNAWKNFLGKLSRFRQEIKILIDLGENKFVKL
jgi:hypothetical protein